MNAMHTEIASRAGVNHVPLPIGEEPGENWPEGMTVFWYRDRPVGHVLVRQGQKSTLHGMPFDSDLLAEVDGEAAEARRPMLPASVVICTRDRPEELKRCLASFPQQTYKPREIIVVDNASRDGRTKEVAEAAGVIYLREDRPGLDIARNTGALRATADIVAYTDDDVLLHPRWLEHMVAAFDKPSIGAVTGLILPAELETEAQLHFELHWGFGQGYRRKDFDAECFAGYADKVFPAWDVGAGASMAFRRELFAKVGLFDERLDVGQAGCSGDSEYWYRLLAHGYTCRYEPWSVAFHYHRRTMEGLASQIFHYMRGHAAALMVQYERTGIRANRQLALNWKPRWYAARLWRHLRRLGRRKPPTDRFLWEEITGYVSGLSFYYRNRSV